MLKPCLPTSTCLPHLRRKHPSVGNHTSATTAATPSPASNKPHAGRQAACPPPAAVNMLKPTTPIKVDRMRTLLVDHPDRHHGVFLHGLERGFSVGYTLPLQNTLSPNLNFSLPAPRLHLDVPAGSLPAWRNRRTPLTPNSSQPCTYPALVSSQRNQGNFASSTTFPPPRAAASMTASQRPTSVSTM